MILQAVGGENQQGVPRHQLGDLPRPAPSTIRANARKTAKPAVDLGDRSSNFYNIGEPGNLPDHNKLNGPPQTSRRWSALLGRQRARHFCRPCFRTTSRKAAGFRSIRVPVHVRNAFIAAPEDKRFYQHKGVDERGLVRAFN